MQVVREALDWCQQRPLQCLTTLTVRIAFCCILSAWEEDPTDLMAADELDKCSALVTAFSTLKPSVNVMLSVNRQRVLSLRAGLKL